ncbi:hypothetical protein niasHS_001161 [Heterodera schachtii]|uniref:Effector protein n=1 Tax=Heterodera schachtii TaxID=97005 RepID=A0ABD2KCD7_HETSC
MHGFGLFLSLFAAINLSRGQIGLNGESKNGPFLMANEFLETGTMLLDELQNQIGNKPAENESDDELKPQKANGKALEAKSDNFQQKAFGFLCGIEMKAKNDEKGNDTQLVMPYLISPPLFLLISRKASQSEDAGKGTITWHFIVKELSRTNVPGSPLSV